MLKTPFSADLEGPANVRAKVVIATAVIGQIEPRAGDIHGFTVCEIRRSGALGRCVKAMEVGFGVVTANWMQDVALVFEKKRRPTNRQAARAASIAGEFGCHIASYCQCNADGIGRCRARGQIAFSTVTGAFTRPNVSEARGRRQKSRWRLRPAPPGGPYGIRLPDV